MSGRGKVYTAEAQTHTYTYERTAITEWLCTKDTSPSTGAKLESKTLIPNYSLRSVIRSFVEARAAATAEGSEA